MEFGPVIKNPVLDINRLVRQGTMLNQSVQTVEGDSTADQATVDLLARKDPVIQEISVGMSGEELTQYTVSGTPPLSLPNSLGKPLKAWSVDVLPKQDLNGYDAPWPAGGGKNLVNYLACVGLGASSNDDTVFYATTAVDGIFTFTGEASYVHGGMIYKGIGAPTPPTTFTVSAEVKSTSTRIIFGIGAYEGGGTSDVNTNFSVTTNTWVKISRTYSNVSYGKIGIFLQPQRDEDVLQVKNVQLESGTTATDYAPYANICPIHGTDKLTITMAGKNFGHIGEDNYVAGQRYTAEYKNGGVVITSTNEYGRAGYSIPVKAGNQYTISLKAKRNGNAYAIQFNDSNEFAYNLWVVVPTETMTTYSRTFTATSDILFVGIYPNAAGTSITVEDFQLEFGSTATTYTPYLAPSQTVITLPQTVYTGTIGSEGGESRQVKRVLNGNENWTGSNTQGIYMQLSGMKKLTSYTANNSMLCENLSVVSNNGNLSDFSITGYADWANSYPNQNWLYIRIDDEHPDATSVKQWLAENPVTVVYEIATPTEFAVTASTIPTPTGTATTWATAEDGTVDGMEVTYVGKV